MMDAYTELRDLCGKANPGPWTISSDPSGFPSYVSIDGPNHWAFAEVVWCMEDDKETGTPRCEATAKYIAAANPATIKALLDELDTLRAAALPSTPTQKFEMIVEEVVEYRVSVDAADEEEAMLKAETLITESENRDRYFSACTGRDARLFDGE